MSDPRDEQRAWLNAVMAQTNLKPTALAKRAGVAQPTITAFMNSKDATHALSARTISKIERATGLRFGPSPRPTGFRESEADPYDPKTSAFDPNFLKNVTGTANSIASWVLKSRALEAAGYLPGDLMVVDLNAEAKPGDVVCAQLYDWARARAETIFRIYEPPYLVAMTADISARKPIVVDNDSVTVKGVMLYSVRPRQARAA